MPKSALKKKTVIPTVRLAPDCIQELAKAIHGHPKVVSIATAIKPTAGARFTKLDASGTGLPASAEKFDAIHDAKTGLIWSAKVIKASSWADAKAKAAEVQIVGAKGRLPEIEELESIRDRTVFKPAADHQFFKFLDLSDWYWSNTPLASAPSSGAWGVLFYGGYSGWCNRYGVGLVLACRSASQ